MRKNMENLEVEPKKKKFTRKTWWIIGGAAVILLVIILIISGNQARKNAAQTYQTETLGKGQLVAVVGATGTVRANQTAYLSWQTSGRVEEVHYGIGEQVSNGEVIASLADTSLPQSVILASSDLLSAQQSLDDLKNSTSSLANAELNLAQAQRDYNTALGNYYTKNSTQGSADQIAAQQAKLQLLNNKIDNLQDSYDAMSDLPNDDTRKNQVLQDLSQAKIDRDTVKKVLDYYQANPDSLDVDILKAKLDIAKNNLEAAQREYDRVKSGIDPTELTAAENKVTALQATVNTSSIIAPFSGTLTEVDAMIGDMVTAGTTDFRIDDLSKLLVDVQVPEGDINSIKVGQSAVLTFDAIANQEYSGKVVSVARVGDDANGVVNFKVTLQLLNPDDQVLPGMTAAVNITVTQLDDVLSVPNRAVRTVNGSTVIYLLKNGQVVSVPVELGAASDTNTQILSGDVQAGDTLILNPPSSLINLMQSSGPMQ
jgi:HlyD family secretion protein